MFIKNKFVFDVNFWLWICSFMQKTAVKKFQIFKSTVLYCTVLYIVRAVL